MKLPTALIVGLIAGSPLSVVANGADPLAFEGGGYYDGLPGMELFWRSTETHIEISMRAQTPTGWMGFGLAEPAVGGMAGSDIVIATVAPSGEVLVSDRYAVGLSTPTEDCSQDWEAVSGSSSETSMEVTLRRKLVTEDGQDRPVAYGEDNIGRPFRVILAFSPSMDESKNFHYHADSRVAAKLNLLDPQTSLDELASMRTDENVFAFEMRPSTAAAVDYRFGNRGGNAEFTEGKISELEVPVETGGGSGYIDMCFNLDDMLPPLSEKANQTVPYSIVGFEHLLDTETKEFVHHFTVHGFYESNDCSSAEGRGSFTIGWAPGAEATATPPSAGYPIANSEASLILSGRSAGVPPPENPLCKTQCPRAEMCYSSTCCVDGEIAQYCQDLCKPAIGTCDTCYPESACGAIQSTNAPTTGRAFRSLKMQVHYDNPNRKTGHTDNSGMRIFVQKTPREHEIGVLQLGDGMLSLMGDEIPTGISRVSSECPASCTQKLLSSVNVFNSQLHSHQTGARMETVTIRDGKTITEGQASPRLMEYYNFGFQEAVSRTFEINPGDALRTSCTYKTSSAQKFGLGSWDEMCIDFVNYYPSDPAFESGYCGSEGSCGGSVIEPLHSIDENEMAQVTAWPGASSADSDACHAEWLVATPSTATPSTGPKVDEAVSPASRPAVVAAVVMIVTASAMKLA